MDPVQVTVNFPHNYVQVETFTGSGAGICRSGQASRRSPDTPAAAAGHPAEGAAADCADPERRTPAHSAGTPRAGTTIAGTTSAGPAAPAGST